ncbi:OLC1v1001844C1 [Oldenlandia corymbosa var. corymbosa]|uniref:OLC1v1001844C1 n=1 Tax=Oldenlandia corymbosa var. corymbosa TaxID=529605 RepID=A0AAV1D918_OLDCO|nr:OLC1v1001844C1 [Oldenlandia corymbosa var. corymbosa]
MAGSKKGRNNNKKRGEKPKPTESNSELSSHQLSKSTVQNVVPAAPVDEEIKALYEEVYDKIELAYDGAFDILLGLGYSSPSAKLALLCGGNIAREKGLNMAENILKNSINFIDNYPLVNGRHAVDVLPCFQTIRDLITCMVQTLVNFAAGLYPNATRRELLQHVLDCKFVDVEGIVKGAGNLDDDETELDEFLKHNILVLQSVSLTWDPEIQGKKINNNPSGSNDKGKNVKLMSEKSLDAKTEDLAMRLEMKVKELEAQVEKRKNRPELFKEVLKTQKIEIASAHLTNMLKMELESRKMNDELEFLERRTSDLQVENSKLRAEISACKVNGAELEKKLKNAMKEEKGTTKKIEVLEGMNASVHSKIGETIQMTLQLGKQLHVIKEASNELEVRVEQALEKQEKANDQRKEEKRSLRIAKETRETMVTTLQQEIEVERKKVEHQWKTFYHESSMLEDTYGFQDGSSSSSSSSQDRLKTFLDNIWDNDCDIPIRPRCIMCLNRVARILFIPCGHQIICIKCRERIADECPCCKEHIQEKVRVFGAT